LKSFSNCDFVFKTFCNSWYWFCL